MPAKLHTGVRISPGPQKISIGSVVGGIGDFQSSGAGSRPVRCSVCLPLERVMLSRQYIPVKFQDAVQSAVLNGLGGRNKFGTEAVKVRVLSGIQSNIFLYSYLKIKALWKIA